MFLISVVRNNRDAKKFVNSQLFLEKFKKSATTNVEPPTKIVPSADIPCFAAAKAEATSL